MYLCNYEVMHFHYGYDDYFCLVMVPVQEHQNLILAVGVQTIAQNIWNIQATMIECKHVSLNWRGENTI